jgi:hypothetical protein
VDIPLSGYANFMFAPCQKNVASRCLIVAASLCRAAQAAVREAIQLGTALNLLESDAASNLVEHPFLTDV